MFFQIVWEVTSGKLANVTPNHREDLGVIISRWHDPARGCGVYIVECDSVELLNEWMGAWSSSCHIEVHPIVQNVKKGSSNVQLKPWVISSQ